jgi:hypothetical protein
MVSIRILGLKKSQRYVIHRMATAIVDSVRKERPDLEAEITVIKDVFEMQRYTPVLVGPSLMVNNKMVCVGRIPSKAEIEGWIQAALEQDGA